jgi:ribonuclease E
MSDMTPAGNTGGDTTTPVAAALADLPARIRVHALAKLLGRSSREVLAAVTGLGVDGRSVQSSIDRELALRVAESFGLLDEPAAEEAEAPVAAVEPRQRTRAIPPTPVFASASPLFLPPEPPAAPVRPAPKPKAEPEPVEDDTDTDVDDNDNDAGDAGDAGDDDGDGDRPRRRRGRRGRGRGKGGQDDGGPEDGDDEPKPVAKQEKTDKPAGRRTKVKAEEAEAEDTDEQESGDGDDAASRRRRRRRRRRGGDGDETNATEDDPPNTVVHVREAREAREEKPESDGRDEVRSVRGSTRLEAKRQRRRDGREAGRRRAPILSEAEFLARREAVDRAMIIRERGERVQIGVLEDGVLVEHFVTSSSGGSLAGNVYLGRVQNVLPSMEAAFVDIGRGRNAVLYAGEVDWDAAGLEGKARKIEQALSTGDSVLVQVTKDPVGHKGARLTTQISLPGRFLVYVPGGGATGISRKLPENERRRLKDVLKRVVPEDAGVIIRTASEGVVEEELARDVRRLQAQWQVIKERTEGANGVRKVGAPSLVYEEPDLLVKVVRDLFTEDFSALVIEGAGAWDTVDAYVKHVAPELADRLSKHVGNTDVFAEYRIEEQLLKALDRKVWLPSGGYLVIDRTEAMTVIDVNTGKFTGSGGNLEETVTRNNLESAEEIVRQLRLRDIGGIIVIDFIDMVLESNRDLVLRRLTECLGRDRTRHQVAEVTSLGLVQMTRKRVGTGLLEAFGTTCEHCKGRGVIVSTEPVSKPGGGSNGQQEPARGSGNTRRVRGGRDEVKDQKDAGGKQQNKDAAKDAVRDIAKAIKVGGQDAEPENQVAESQRTDVATETNGLATEEAPQERSGRRRSRDRANRASRAAGPAESNGRSHQESPAGADDPTASADQHTSAAATALDTASAGAGSEHAEASAAASSVGDRASASAESAATSAAGDTTASGDQPASTDLTGSTGEASAPRGRQRSRRDRTASTRGDQQASSAAAATDEPQPATGDAAATTAPATTTVDPAEQAAPATEPSEAPVASSQPSERHQERTNGNGDRSEQAGDAADESSVPAPATPPRRQPRRAASRPAGPPVAAGHDG